MPPNNDEELTKLLGNGSTLQHLREFADPSNPNPRPTFLHGKPRSGNSSKIPIAMSLIDPGARIVSIQPTDQAASWAFQCAKALSPPGHVAHTPLWKEVDKKIIDEARISFVSARQVLRHGANILETATIIVIDEVHFLSTDHELAIALVKRRASGKDSSNKRILLTSSYLNPAMRNADLLPGLAHFDLAPTEDREGRSRCEFAKSNSDCGDRTKFLESVARILNKIPDGGGPVLIFIPSPDYMTPLRIHLAEKNIAVLMRGGKKPDKGSQKWNIRKYTSLRETFGLEDFENITMDGSSVIISPLCFDKSRILCADKGFAHVICPHWAITERYDTGLGREIPVSAQLSKPEMQCLLHYGDTAWFTCTVSTWSRAPDEAIAEVERLSATAYLLKAASLFPGESPHGGDVNAMPLRIFPTTRKVCWALQELTLFGLVNPLRKGHKKLILASPGEDVLGYMLDFGLSLRAARLINNIVNCEDTTEDPKIGTRLLHVAIPLAVSMGQASPVIRYSAKTDSEKDRVEKLNAMLGRGPNETESQQGSGYRRYGDAFCSAWLLVRHLAGGRQQGHGDWAFKSPAHLQDIVSLIRRKLSLTNAHAGEAYGPLAEELFKNLDGAIGKDGRSFVEIFQQCVYGTSALNTAFVQDKKVREGESIGRGVDVSTGKPVLLSLGSVLDMKNLDHVEYVTYGSMEAVERDVDRGPSLVVSHISPVSAGQILDSLLDVSTASIDKPRNLGDVIRYPYNSEP